jgi:Protein of unknown function (DUF998)
MRGRRPLCLVCRRPPGALFHTPMDNAAMSTGHDAWTRRMLTGGAIGGPLFVAVFSVEGVRREGYDPLREPVSALALGERGWVQRTNFVATGMLMLACSRGLGRLPADHPAASRWGARLLGLYAIGLVGAGVFVTDPVEYGAPGPATPIEPSQRGVLHELFSLQVFAALGIAALTYASRFARTRRPAWAVMSALAGVLVPGGLVVFGQALAGEGGLRPIAGLIQRLTICAGWSWISALALAARRMEPRP